MRRVMQTMFGARAGDCFAACVASILDLPREAVPHFCAVPDGEDWFADFQTWLAARGLVAFEAALPVPLVPCLARMTPGALIIVAGPSPNALPELPCLHACVARATDDGAGFEIVHDPHPSGLGIEGEVTHVTVIGNLYRE